MPAVEYTSTARQSPLPSAAVARPDQTRAQASMISLMLTHLFKVGGTRNQRELYFLLKDITVSVRVRRGSTAEELE